jgi:putative phage-type endonuclease
MSVIVSAFDRDAWLAQRRECICATDVAAICIPGYPYGSPFSVYRDKQGFKQDVQTEAMEHGLGLEEYIAHWWARKNGKEIRKSEFMRHPDHAWAAATPDYEIVGEDAYLECKNVSYWVGRDFGPAGSDELPDWFVTQGQWQMGIGAKSKIHYAVFVGGNEMRDYGPVPFDKTLFDFLFRKCSEYRDAYLIPDNPPPLNESDHDKRWVDGAHKLVALGERIMSTPDVDALCKELGQIRNMKWAGESIQQGLETKIKDFMASAEMMDTTSGPFTWRPAAGRTTTDWMSVAIGIVAYAAMCPDPELIKKEFDRLVEANTKTGLPTRRFVTPWKVGGGDEEE